MPKAPTMDPASLTIALKEESLRLGFDLAGATRAVALPDFERLSQWLAEGCAAGMHYLADRLEAYRHPSAVLEGVASILMLATNYRTVEPAMPEDGQARVARYAWGLDYHELIRDRLRQLADFHLRLVPSARVRGVVDTAPLFEKRFAQLAGLGSIGKNTTLINPRFGSWLVLGALLTTEVLDYDQPAAADCCGECRACLDACPTEALVAPGRLDARKCISYLTIESRDEAVGEAVAARGKWIFGCDACQEACPWNRLTPPTDESAFRPGSGMNPVDASRIQALDEPGFRQQFAQSPLRRAGRDAILRNIGRTRGP
jgi:epoxyqueuosine reductase